MFNDYFLHLTLTLLMQCISMLLCGSTLSYSSLLSVSGCSRSSPDTNLRPRSSPWIDQVRHLLFVSVIFCSVFSLIRPPLVDAHSQIPRHLLHLSDRHLPPLGALCVQTLKCAEGRNVSVFSPNPVRQCCLYFFNATQNGPSPHREVSQTSAFTAIH